MAAKRVPVGSNATEVTLSVPPSVATQVAGEPSVDSRHNFTVQSWLPVAKRVPVGLNATELTQLLCPSA